VKGLFRSGWWAAVACGIVSVVVVVAVLRLGGGEARAPRGDGRHAESYGFDLSFSLVPVDEIVASGMMRDGLRALNHPGTMTPEEILEANEKGRGKLLVGSDRVIGFAAGRQARAYPLRLLRWHEVVNDTVGDRAIAVTYNPLCDSAVVFSREVGGEVLSFAVSGLLLNSNLLMYEVREDGSSSLWSQLQARAIAGNAARQGTVLQVLDGQLATWDWWLEQHPESTVMAPETDLKRLYKRDPYHSYFGSDVLRFPVNPMPVETGLRLKDRVVAIQLGDERRVYALPHLAAASGRDSGSIRTRVGGYEATLKFAREPGIATFVVEDAAAPRPELIHAFWFAWYAAHPDAHLDTPPAAHGR
jgi:hypothetical protein